MILHEDHKLPIAHVNMWFHVGSKDEKPGRTGLAHLFEHLMFQGSKNAPGEYFKYAEAAGANLMGGGVNGTTSYDRTNYFITVPSANLEYALWLESDRVATLADTMTQRERLRREVSTLTAEGKISAFIIGGLPPALAVVMFVMNPEYIKQLFSPGIGYALIAAAVVMMGIGFAWMKKCITIEV